MAPRVTKAAIVGVDLSTMQITVVVMQYTPESVTRNLQGQAAGDGGARSEAQRLKGPPIETFKFDAEIDAADQLDAGQVTARTLGIHPQLAAMETLLYPSSGSAVVNTALLATGVLEVAPPVGPLTLLVWGVTRVLPVRLTEFTVTEELHDAALNPLRARVSLGLRVLTYDDLPITHPGYYIYLTHHIGKESLARIGSVGGLGAGLPAGLKLF